MRQWRRRERFRPTVSTSRSDGRRTGAAARYFATWPLLDELRPLLAEQHIHFSRQGLHADRRSFSISISHDGLPGADAARLRPRSSVPVYFEPRRIWRSGAASASHQIRAREGAAHAAALLELPRTCDRRQPDICFPGKRGLRPPPGAPSRVDIVSAHLFRVIRTRTLWCTNGHRRPARVGGPRLNASARGGFAPRGRERHASAVLNILMENFEIAEATSMSSHIPQLVWGSPTGRRLGACIAPVERRTHRLTQAVRRADSDLFEQLKYQDCLLHHPFDCFARSKIHQDRRPRSERHCHQDYAVPIGRNSPLVNLLIKAADAGKQVPCCGTESPFR